MAEHFPSGTATYLHLTSNRSQYANTMDTGGLFHTRIVSGSIRAGMVKDRFHTGGPTLCSYNRCPLGAPVHGISSHGEYGGERELW